MYERYYNLRDRPFALTPDPDYLYMSRGHREALDSLRYGIESSAGFIVITGDIGAGKTTLLQTLVRRLDERTIVGRLVNTMLEPHELLEAIALEFGLEVTGKSKPLLLRELGQFLVQARSQGSRPLLMIDEAQNLTARGLEEVRLLSNLETEKSKLLQMVFVGQPGLRDMIASSDLTQFRQRVAVSYHLGPLDAHETAGYIDFRLRRAAIGVPPQFSAEAVALVHTVSGGVPRVINVVCDATLLCGYAAQQAQTEQQPQIDISLVREAVAELQGTQLLPAEVGHTASTHIPAAGVSAASTSASFEAPRKVTLTTEPAARLLETPDHNAAEIAALAARLAEQERSLALREEELAEQRQILAEEFRILRNLHRQGVVTSGRSATPPAAPEGVTPLPITLAEPQWLDATKRWLRRVFSNPLRRTVADN
jgi:general secretion pathway protein A